MFFKKENLQNWRILYRGDLMEYYNKKIIAIMIAVLIVSFAAGSWYTQKKQEKELRQSELIILNENINIHSGEEESEPDTIVVFVTGAVVNPGIYQLPKSSRFYEAIEKAGGLLPDAESKFLPMARIIEDEETIYIPKVGEEEAEHDNTSLPNLNSNSNKININKATATELATLDGIGPSLSQRIVDYRNSNGPFKDISEIKNVSGIGEKRFEAIKDKITTK